jgi:uncharacterized protein YfiM (DUF2279 family)
MFLKKLSILLSSLVLCTAAMAGEEEKDSWTGADKVGHFVVFGMIPSQIVTIHTGNKWYGFATGVGIGALKELSDSRTHKASGKDFVVTAIGAAVGAYTGGWILTKIDKTTLVAYSSTF